MITFILEVRTANGGFVPTVKEMSRADLDPHVKFLEDLGFEIRIVERVEHHYGLSV